MDIIEGDEHIDIRSLIDESESLDSTYTLLSEYMQNTTNVQTHLRGYSSHEKVHEVGLVNMNARMYDPVIGQFISADFIIPDMTRPLISRRVLLMYSQPRLH